MHRRSFTLERERPTLGVIVVTLCITEIVSWGLLYFTFPVIAPLIASETGWSPVSVAAAFSVALAAQGLIGVQVGRVLDAHGPRLVMTLGSILAVIGLVIVATAPNLPMFFLGWLIIGCAQAGVLYPPAFAAITGWFTTGHLAPLTAVTLVAGFASTVFAPLTAFSGEQFGWRTTYLIAAVVMTVVTLPAHWFVLRRPWPQAEQVNDETRAADRVYTSRVIRSARFWLLTIGFTTVSIATFSALLALVPLLLERGLDPQTAAWVLGMGGVGQVTGRVFYMAIAKRASLVVRTVASFGLSTLAIILLVCVSGSPALYVAIWVSFGLGLGVTTLLRATAVTDRWGPRAYGYLNGVIGLPSVIASAVAPLAGATLALTLGDYTAAFAVLSVLAVAGTVLMVLSARGLGAQNRTSPRV